MDVNHHSPLHNRILGGQGGPPSQASGQAPSNKMPSDGSTPGVVKAGKRVAKKVGKVISSIDPFD